MKIALLGLPQSGKKTLFTLLTGRNVPASRKPAEALEGIAPISDPRVDKLTEICKSEKKVYAENNFMLCPDVTEGNSADWLNSARKADMLCLVIRTFESDQIYHPLGAIDAARDVSVIESELLLADMQIIEKRLQRIEKEKRAGQSAEQVTEEQTLRKCMEALENDKKIFELKLTPQEFAPVKSLELITRLPILHVYNVSESDFDKFSGPDSVTVSCLIEREIMDIDDIAERRDFMESLGLTTSGIDRVNAAAYETLGLMSFYTTGKDESRAWTIKKGSSAPEAGGKIHTDIQRGFIRVEVIKYDDLVAAGSENAAKEKGKLATNGKDYIIQDGDVCHFLFNV